MNNNTKNSTEIILSVYIICLITFSIISISAFLYDNPMIPNIRVLFLFEFILAIGVALIPYRRYSNSYFKYIGIAMILALSVITMPLIFIPNGIKIIANANILAQIDSALIVAATIIFLAGQNFLDKRRSVNYVFTILTFITILSSLFSLYSLSYSIFNIAMISADLAVFIVCITFSFILVFYEDIKKESLDSLKLEIVSSLKSNRLAFTLVTVLCVVSVVLGVNLGNYAPSNINVLNPNQNIINNQSNLTIVADISDEFGRIIYNATIQASTDIGYVSGCTTTYGLCDIIFIPPNVSTISYANIQLSIGNVTKNVSVKIYPTNNTH